MKVFLPHRRAALAGAVALAAALIAAPLAAQAEDAGITVYNAQHESLTKAWAEAFTKETGIKVTLRNGGDTELGNQLVQEGDKSPADVFLTENSPAMVLVDNAKLFAPLSAEMIVTDKATGETSRREVTLSADEGPRADTSLEKLGSLKPAFDPTGTVTAGNASPLNDGASAVLLGSPEAADALGRDPVARVAGRGASALEPQRFGFAPVEAANLALKRAGIGWSDVGAVELNEAFAVQSLACVDAWGIDPAIVNTRGGAIAIGHPLGASGGRILGTLAKVMREDGHRWGVAAICIGVGQGLAVVLENVR